MPSHRPTAIHRPRRRARASTILIALWVFGALALGALLQPDAAIADGMASVEMLPPTALSAAAPEMPPIVALVVCAVVAIGAVLIVRSGRWRAVPQTVRTRVSRRR